MVQVCSTVIFIILCFQVTTCKHNRDGLIIVNNLCTYIRSYVYLLKIITVLISK